MITSIFRPLTHKCVPSVRCLPCPTSIHSRTACSNPTSPSIYHHVDDVERLERYQPGGYHPIQIEDQLHGRYRVAHKLGYGTFSTTWLAQDELHSGYVAIKVGTAESDQREIDILAQLAKRQPWRGPYSDLMDLTTLVPTILDRFDIHGSNGTHPCFVTTPARCSLADTEEASGSKLFQLDTARSIVAQLALAVTYIHSLGYVHGDLHLGNILLQASPSLSHLARSQLYERFGHPDPEPVSRVDGQPLAAGVPLSVFSPIWMGQASEDIAPCDSRLLLADFGVAFCPLRESRYESYTLLEIRPPEARFEPTNPLSFPSDIWSLACTIWAVMGQRSFLDSFLLSQDDATADQVDALGPLPSEWWDKWKTRAKMFAGNGEATENRSIWSWDQRFESSIQEPRRDEAMEMFVEEEASAFLAMIRWMLAFRPADRPSAEQVLQSEWMATWAIPSWKRAIESSS